jgi:hypothetical protein
VNDDGSETSKVMFSERFFKLTMPFIAFMAAVHRLVTFIEKTVPIVGCAIPNYFKLEADLSFFPLL